MIVGNWRVNNNFCLGNVSEDYTKEEQNENIINGTVYDFSVDHTSLQKEDILNIPKYLMVKKYTKQCLGFIKKYLSD